MKKNVLFLALGCILTISCQRITKPKTIVLASTSIGSDSGASLVIAHTGAGNADEWSIPANATISITTARGFGPLTQVDSNSSKAQVETDVDAQLNQESIQ